MTQLDPITIIERFRYSHHTVAMYFAAGMTIDEIAMLGVLFAVVVVSVWFPIARNEDRTLRVSHLADRQRGPLRAGRASGPGCPVPPKPLSGATLIRLFGLPF